MKFSVIIPVRTITPFVRETVSYLKKQTEKDFEIIIVTDKKEYLEGTKVIASGEPTPAYKRNFGVSKSKGDYLAFLDDDSYPVEKWLVSALAVFKEDNTICAVCGPTLTPPSDNVFRQASGEVWASCLGSGGAGVYRNKVMPRREVDDFPSVNLIVKKKDFDKVGGFDVLHWPGEDTKLCLDLVKLNKKIIYDPSIVVYHHRRPILIPHLKQIERYALRRGYFAKVFPETSFRIGYLFPSFFTYGLIFGLIFSLFSTPFFRIYLFLLFIYVVLLVVTGIEVLLKRKNIYLFFLVPLAIFATHFWYGLLFPIGYFSENIKTTPHKLDEKKKTYVGG